MERLCEYCHSDISHLIASAKTCDDTCRNALYYLKKKKLKDKVIEKRNLKGIVKNFFTGKQKSPMNSQEKHDSPENSPENSPEKHYSSENSPENSPEKHEFTGEKQNKNKRMSNNPQIEFYLARIDELKETLAEVKADKKECERENKAHERTITDLSRKIAIIEDKHSLQIERTGIESSSTLGGFAKDLSKPENLESIASILGIIKDWRKPNEPAQNENKQIITTGDPEKDEFINTIVEACNMKDKIWVAKLLNIVEQSMSSELLEEITQRLTKKG